MNARFISFEGIEGAGKSTAMEGVFLRLAPRTTVIKTREPGGTAFGECVRELFKAHDASALAELYLIMAARVEHLQQVIQPALARGTWVICDRYYHSTIAYQGYGKMYGDGAFLSKITQLHEGIIMPNAVYWLDLPLDVAKNRVNLRGQKDRFDDAKDDFLARTHEGFLAQYEQDQRMVRIHANTHADEVVDLIVDDLAQRFRI